jgi:hypothetical protein
VAGGTNARGVSLKVEGSEIIGSREHGMQIVVVRLGANRR